MNFDRSSKLRQKAHSLIPGGAHTYAKGDDQYPLQAPGFIVRGQGCHVWDADGNEFIEYGMGLRAVTLGHAFEPVVAAATDALKLGSNFTRPSPIEIDAAETLLGLIPGAEMAKFAKNGSDVTTAAVKLARAATGRRMIAVCQDHPFYSVNDWFIGTTAMNAGIPDFNRELVAKFRYNDIESVKRLFAAYPRDIAAVMLEPETTQPPGEQFLHKLRELAHRHGALFVFDEMITGFRWHIGGGQAFHGVEPDLATFGKAIGNGFSVAALVGKRQYMRLGGLDHDRERVFLLSTTHGGETHALAAAIATMRYYREHDVVAHLWRQGERLARGVNQAIARHRLQEYVSLAGRPCNLVYATCNADHERSQSFRALFLQELIRHGVIAPSFVVSYSHADTDIDRTIDAVDRALSVYAKALTDGVEKHLVGRPVKPVFRKYN